MPKPSSWVYFIQAGHSGPIKIGVATDVKKRLRALQTGHPHKLRVVAQIPGDRSHERLIHAQFKDTRLNGEWFKASAKLKQFIQVLLLEHANRQWEEAERQEAKEDPAITVGSFFNPGRRSQPGVSFEDKTLEYIEMNRKRSSPIPKA